MKNITTFIFVILFFYQNSYTETKTTSSKSRADSCVLSFYLNKVTVKDEKDSTVELSDKMVLREGYSIAVEKNSSAEIDFGQDRFVTINQKAKIRLALLRPTLKEVFLEYGKVLVKGDDKQRGAKHIRIRTPVSATQEK